MQQTYEDWADQYSSNRPFWGEWPPCCVSILFDLVSYWGYHETHPIRQEAVSDGTIFGISTSEQMSGGQNHRTYSFQLENKNELKNQRSNRGVS